MAAAGGGAGLHIAPVPGAPPPAQFGLVAPTPVTRIDYRTADGEREEREGEREGGKIVSPRVTAQTYPPTDI
jgi:hypothetical protein